MRAGVVGRAEVVAGPTLVLAMFFGALAVGLMASRPVDQARRRQLEFTADASHELRTPLAVIGAEVGLALSSPGDGSSYRGILARIGTEGNSLRAVVEDLLFLARFDAKPTDPGVDAFDLVTLAEACGLRFATVALAKGIEFSVVTDGAGAMGRAQQRCHTLGR
jgi:signal transduction histidine kinase